VPGSADETGAAGYRPLLFSIAYGMTGSVGDAEDIVQVAFLGLTRARQAGTTVADPKAYLTTAVTRLGINHLRSARVRLPGCGEDHRQDRGELPADLRPRQAAHRRRKAGARQEDTEFFGGGLSERGRQERLDKIPAGRPGHPDEIAAVAYLSSPEAGYVNGEIHHVNGGWVPGR
jgi:DNA-directed RNA polymerase specialized sigma24 family protein